MESENRIYFKCKNCNKNISYKTNIFANNKDSKKMRCPSCGEVFILKYNEININNVLKTKKTTKKMFSKLKKENFGSYFTIVILVLSAYFLIVYLPLSVIYLAIKDSINKTWFLILGSFALIPVYILLVKKKEIMAGLSRCEHGIRGGKTKSKCQACINNEYKSRQKEKCAREKQEEEMIRLKKEKEQKERLILEERERESRQKKEEQDRNNRNKQEEEERINKLRMYHEEIRLSEFSRLRSHYLSTLDFLCSLKPFEFETTIINMFRKLGFIVDQTGQVNDRGKDGIAFKDGKKYLIECKRYNNTNRVGRPMLQKFFAAMHEEQAERGFFVTTSSFASTTREYGKVNNIDLIDGVELTNLMNRAYPHYGSNSEFIVTCLKCGRYEKFFLNGKAKSAICQNCGSRVVKNIIFDDLRKNK